MFSLYANCVGAGDVLPRAARSEAFRAVDVSPPALGVKNRRTYVHRSECVTWEQGMLVLREFSPLTRGIHIPRSPNCTTIWDARENCSPAIVRLAQFSDGSFTRYGSRSLALKNCCSATS